ncbi:hypothetical protein MLD38_004982 [Melastoma candidum]|uniref:Uncharacterized protein n=1 Tax=Melastoma candidum TaxID=119954 RepID=A0ACB9S8Z4_9MYRT|nr:hypothetical protein MLD38_004982 [Melastoma candidum]
MAPFEALYGRSCRSPLCWMEPGEKVFDGPELIKETSDVIAVVREKMKTSQSRQKSYADRRRRPLEFEVGGRVYLRLSPMKSMFRMGKAHKLSPRYIGPYEITERVGKVAYRVAIPPELSHCHDVFHVSMLRKHEPDLESRIEAATTSINENMSVTMVPVRVIGRKERVTRGKGISLVHVLWRKNGIEEQTWELEDRMKYLYPSLFE